MTIGRSHLDHQRFVGFELPTAEPNANVRIPADEAMFLLGREVKRVNGCLAFEIAHPVGEPLRTPDGVHRRAHQRASNMRGVEGGRCSGVIDAFDFDVDRRFTIFVQEGLSQQDLFGVASHAEPVAWLFGLARDDLEVTVRIRFDFCVVEMTGATRDLVLRGKVLVRRGEAHVVNAPAIAPDAVPIARVDPGADVVVVRVVEPHFYEFRHGTELRIFGPGSLRERKQACAQKSAEIPHPLGAVEGRKFEVVAQNDIAALLEQVAEIVPRFGVVDLGHRIIRHLGSLLPSII